VVQLVTSADDLVAALALGLNCESLIQVLNEAREKFQVEGSHFELYISQKQKSEAVAQLEAQASMLRILSNVL
jgi:hypothetical protein